jgi:hypothetical protein
VTSIQKFRAERFHYDFIIENARINKYRALKSEFKVNQADLYDFVVVVSSLARREKLDELVKMGAIVILANFGRFAENEGNEQLFLSKSFLGLCWYEQVIYINNDFTLIGDLSLHSTLNNHSFGA